MHMLMYIDIHIYIYAMLDLRGAFRLYINYVYIHMYTYECIRKYIYICTLY